MACKLTVSSVRPNIIANFSWDLNHSSCKWCVPQYNSAVSFSGRSSERFSPSKMPWINWHCSWETLTLWKWRYKLIQIFKVWHFLNLVFCNSLGTFKLNKAYSSIEWRGCRSFYAAPKFLPSELGDFAKCAAGSSEIRANSTQQPGPPRKSSQ